MVLLLVRFANKKYFVNLRAFKNLLKNIPSTNLQYQAHRKLLYNTQLTKNFKNRG